MQAGGVPDSQGTSLCKNCSQGGGQACKRQEVGQPSANKRGKAEGPGEVERIVRGAQVMESEGTPSQAPPSGQVLG